MDVELERRLLAAIRDGSVSADEAMALIYRELAPGLHRLCHGLIGRRDGADRVLAHVMLEVYRQWPQFPERVRLSTWIHRIALRMALRECVETMDSETGNIAAAGAIDNPRTSGQELVEQRLRAALRLLPGEQRAVFVLAAVEQLSLVQIAEILNLSVDTTRSRLRRAEQRFKQSLYLT